jgi:GSH-dependent disulfide-bond oxidoreductase
MRHFDFPIASRWPATKPDAIQLYSLPTPNGQKIGVALEEMELDYEAHLVSFSTRDQFTPEFLSLSPNNKIPAMIDPHGPDGEPVAMFESGAMLIYLAEKSGKFLPRDAVGRFRVLQWLMWQMGGVGPMFGQVGYFVKFAGKEIEDPRPRQRYLDEAKRLLGVLDRQLEGQDWVAGDYSIADMAIGPWLGTLVNTYQAGALVGFDDFGNVKAYFDRFFARPAAQKAKNIPPRG